MNVFMVSKRQRKTNTQGQWGGSSLENFLTFTALPSQCSFIIQVRQRLVLITRSQPATNVPWMPCACLTSVALWHMTVIKSSPDTRLAPSNDDCRKHTYTRGIYSHAAVRSGRALLYRIPPEDASVQWEESSRERERWWTWRCFWSKYSAIR